MGVEPQLARCDGWIDVQFTPPGGFIPAAVQFAMMAATQRHRELITDFAAKGHRLGETQVMSIAGGATTDEAGLPAYVPDVLAVANAARFRDGKNALVDAGVGWRPRLRRQLASSPSFAPSSWTGRRSLSALCFRRLRCGRNQSLVR